MDVLPLTLTVVTGPAAGYKVDRFRQGAVTIGRTKAAVVQLDRDAEVSQKHAEIAWDTGAWYLKDLGSSNGTTIYFAENQASVECKAGKARLLPSK